jgi:hypothetical protein
MLQYFLMEVVTTENKSVCTAEKTHIPSKQDSYFHDTNIQVSCGEESLTSRGRRE